MSVGRTKHRGCRREGDRLEWQATASPFGIGARREQLARRCSLTRHRELRLCLWLDYASLSFAACLKFPLLCVRLGDEQCHTNVNRAPLFWSVTPLAAVSSAPAAGGAFAPVHGARHQEAATSMASAAAKLLISQIVWCILQLAVRQTCLYIGTGRRAANAESLAGLKIAQISSCHREAVKPARAGTKAIG
ncbi:hypothetical protein K469DRAFT_690629 [Zopfia rhizophila CBS 207.26]|uniref:Uncharacterized protein n=1 Tax=Zopfia rhizophila CBS 207.26 TaxID=1314779 RepID=A0A6A6DSB6_9PEZI|nr:hypothetical protein K469DRAFT_690629 [Zopfia rhizophila CBS 207.26]